MNYLEIAGARPSSNLKEAPRFSASAAWKAGKPEVFAEAVPEAITLPIAGNPVNQNAIPCCVGIALTAAMEFVGSTVPLSPLFNYYFARLDPKIIDDVRISNAFESAAVDGVCALPLHTSKFDTASALAAPSAAAIVEAASHRLNVTPIGLPSYGTVDVDVEEWKASIAISLPVLVGFFMSPEYDAIRNKTTVELRTPSATGRGHAVLAIGYDETAQHFIVRDARGTDIGISGTWHLPYARLAEGFIFESWVVTAVP